MHHVAARSIAGEHIFKDTGDYTTAIGILAGLVADGFLACHAFCFMPTHYHVYGTFDDVATTIHKLNRRYAVAFNRRYRRRGHVFDSPFARKPVEHEWQARRLARIHRPQSARPRAVAVRELPGLIGARPAFSFVDPSPILESFGSIDVFRAFVDEGTSSRRREPGSGLRPATGFVSVGGRVLRPPTRPSTSACARPLA